MDKYAVYHNIKSAQSIVAQYPAAESVSQELKNLANQLASRVYRVAVIGEFKRGKSSLVNCILGTEILPTDILPTTAVVNRTVYGSDPKIEICYKDGTRNGASIEDLVEYATKKNEVNASHIKEIVVHYPAVFCQNNIELLDTPGLNDDEFMDQTTLDVLDKIDTAIVVTHASYPVSETEKNLICRLIEQDDIYHLTFVATFIDQVSDEVDEQDEVVKLIRNRLAKETYQIFCIKHPNEPKLIEKATRILCNPVVFAVSSRLAMRGFVNGNKKMLDESRFPHFKYELSALLTANQELDLQMKAVRIIHVANENFASWHKHLLSELETDLSQTKKRLQLAQFCQKSGCPGLMDRLQQVDRELENNGIYLSDNANFENENVINRIVRIILRNLLHIEPEIENESLINDAFSCAEDEIKRILDSRIQCIEQVVHGCMEKANEYVFAFEKSCGMSESRLTGRLTAWKSSTSFPRLDRSTYDLARIFDVSVVQEKIRVNDIVALAEWIHIVVCNEMNRKYPIMHKQLQGYIATWRKQLLMQNLEDKNEMGGIAENAAQRIRNIRQKKDSVTVNYASNLSVLVQAEQVINREQV